MVTTIFKEDIEELSRAAVEILVAEINKLLEQKEQIILVIPGGRSVAALWNLLADEQRIPWSKVQVFLVDERVVPPTHADSNYKLDHDLFLKKLMDSGQLPKENVHPFNPEDNEDKVSINYNEELKKYGKPDIIILSSGEDGHVGALYPNHSVKNEAEGYIVMDDSPKPPPVRMSMSRKTMLAATAALLFFVGQGKKDAYEKFKQGDDIIECPARLVKQIKDSYVLTDLKN